MKTKRTYWINTVGKKRIFAALLHKQPEDSIVMMYNMKTCNWFVYYVFRNLKINLIAEDKLAWLRHS